MGRGAGGAGGAGGSGGGGGGGGSEAKELAKIEKSMASDEKAYSDLLSKERAYDKLNNDGREGYNPYRDKRKEVQKSLDKKKEAHYEAKIKAEWTKETTSQRRAEWNARVRSGEFTDKKTGKVDMRKLTEASKKQGWDHISLGLHIKRHGL